MPETDRDRRRGARRPSPYGYGESFFVVPVGSELELREKMPGLGSSGKPMAFVVPWSGEIPIDLAGRFSHDGRIKRIGKDSRLLRLLGATALGDGVLGSPLAEHLLAHPNEIDNGASMGGVVTLEALFDRWMKGRFGIDTTGGLALDLLLGWAATDDDGHTALSLEAENPKLAQAVEAHIHRTLREAGVAVWKAWKRKRGRALLELAVLFEALAHHSSGPAFTWRGMQRAELDVADDDVASRVAAELGTAVGRALLLANGKQPGIARAILASADASVTAPDVRALLIESKRLPVAFRLRQDALGEALLEGAKHPGPAALAKALDAQALLSRHEQMLENENLMLARRADRAIQLLAWLSTPSPAPEPALETPQRDAEVLGRWYANEGAFVDRARRDARGLDGDLFGKGVQAVVSRADDLRAELDRRFARSLAGWVEAGRPQHQALAIDAAAERVAIRYLDAEPTRKVLVLLMDGMSWPVLLSLLESLGQWSVPWGPIAWHASPEGRHGAGTVPVMFAQLPTVTEVSRAAFFAGKATTAGTSNTTADDPKRWLAHKAVSKVEAEGVAPRLLLRGEGHTTDGAASSEALSLVSDPARRLVAIVINAIDASLKGDTQQRHEWTVESIPSLAQLLDAARAAGRTVLLTADHGHVPGDLLVSKGTFPGAGPRWRPWTEPTEAPLDGEVAFHGTGVWSPKGAHGIFALADDRARYGGGAHAGEHGGASLAEVVTPCLLLAPDDGRDVVDRLQKVVPLEVPSWWHREVELPPNPQASIDAIAPRKPPKKRKTPPEGQLAMPLVSPATSPVTPAKTRPSSTSTPAVTGAVVPEGSAFRAFAKNELFASRCANEAERKKVLTALQYLVDRHDSAHVDAFTTALGEPVWRATGLVRKLQEILNVDGYASITHDLEAKQVRLERTILETQFGVKL